MTRIRPTFILSCLLMTAPLTLPAMAQETGSESAQAGTLSVTGQGQVFAAPDLAIVSLGVTSEADDAAGALGENNDRHSAVIEALKAAGIDSRDMQTSQLRLDQRMAHQENQAPTIQGYTASNMLTVRIRDLDQLGAILDDAIKAGATNLDSLTFQREDDADLLDQARQAAVEDALHRATVLAEAANASLGPIRVIEEASDAAGPRPMAMMARMSADSVPVEAGELGISANIRIEFELEQ